MNGVLNLTLTADSRRLHAGTTDEVSAIPGRYVVEHGCSERIRPADDDLAFERVGCRC